MNSGRNRAELEVLRRRERQEKVQDRKWVLRLFLGLLFLFFLMSRVFGIAVIQGNSMRPALHSGDLVIYLRIYPKDLSYGDMVILHSPEDKDIVKRIVGLPGDVIEVKERGEVIRNSLQLVEPEVLYGNQSMEEWIRFPHTVPEGEFFYLGDNRPVSSDSRDKSHGTAKRNDIRGKVVAILRIGDP